MSKPAFDSLIKTRDIFLESSDSQSLFVASALSAIAGTLCDPEGHDNLKRISDFTASVSRERIAQIESERRNKC